MARLFALAHEGGHFESQHKRMSQAQREAHAAARQKMTAIWNREGDASAFGAEGQLVDKVEYNERARSACLAKLTECGRNLIVSEERLAWEFGRDTLEAQGWTDFEA